MPPVLPYVTMDDLEYNNDKYYGGDIHNGGGDD